MSWCWLECWQEHGTPLDMASISHRLCAEERLPWLCCHKSLTGEPAMTVPLGFVALLQGTPVESPDSNFAGLAAGEQDAEVT